MLKFRELASYHNRKEFDCGIKELNQFLAEYARQNQKKGLSKTFVLTHTEQSNQIIAYFTLSVFEVTSLELPIPLNKKYRNKVPGLKLARLAVDLHFQNQGFGNIAIAEVMKKTLNVSQNVGLVGLFVDAKNQKALQFYKKYGFIALKDEISRLLLPIQTVKSLF